MNTPEIWNDIWLRTDASAGIPGLGEAGVRWRPGQG